jgi:hypothetical protein
LKTQFRLGRYLLLASALLALLAAMWAGLLRLDLDLPWLQAALALSHGPLMVCGFLGTLISLERSVALNRWWAYAAPLLTALGTIGLIVGIPGLSSPLLISLGSLALVWNLAVILRRQTAVFTATIAFGALAWLIGNILWLFKIPIPSMVHWWAGFLVLTIVGERLELSRLVSHSSRVTGLFVVAAGIFVAGLMWASLNRFSGLEIAGVGLILLALWLFRFDVARRAVRQAGLPRFIAISLLSGYFWLAVGGVFWIRARSALTNPDLQSFHYDAMLHSVFLGFVFSMIFAHAPLIFPAILGKALTYRKALYAHVFLLHFAVLLRIGSDLYSRFVIYRWSGILNVLAITVFLLNTAYGISSGGRKSGKPANAPALG